MFDPNEFLRKEEEQEKPQEKPFDPFEFLKPAEAPVVADVSCPLCHKGKLLERTSKFGKIFYGCDGYPACDFVLNFKPAAGTCRHCGFALLAEKPTASGIKLICASKKCQLPQAE